MNNKDLEESIEKSFRTEPEYHLPAGFAQKITTAVVVRTRWLADLYDYIYLSAIVVFLAAVAVCTYYLVNKELVLKFFSFISTNAIPVVMAVFILNFIFFADRVLLRLLFNRWHKT